LLFHILVDWYCLKCQTKRSKLPAKEFETSKFHQDTWNRYRKYWQQFQTVSSGPGLGPNRILAKLDVWIMNESEPSTRVCFDSKLAPSLNLVGCQRVAQRVQLFIPVRHLHLHWVKNILSKSCVHQPILCCCLLCSLQHRLIWYLCFTSERWYFSLSRCSVIQLCA